MFAGSIDWQPRYTQLRNDNSILLFGASIRNISNESKEIAIYGQRHKSLHYDETITRCCVRYAEGNIVELPIERRIYRPQGIEPDHFILRSFMFVCTIPFNNKTNDHLTILPTHASFRLGALQCTDKNHSFIPIFMALKSKPMTIGTYTFKKNTIQEIQQYQCKII